MDVIRVFGQDLFFIVRMRSAGSEQAISIRKELKASIGAPRGPQMRKAVGINIARDRPGARANCSRSQLLWKRIFAQRNPGSNKRRRINIPWTIFSRIICG